MKEFLKELNDLCIKHNKFIVGTGMECDSSMRILDNKELSYKLGDKFIEYNSKTKQYQEEK